MNAKSFKVISGPSISSTARIHTFGLAEPVGYFDERASRYLDGHVEMKLRGKVLCSVGPGPEADDLWECIESIAQCGKPAEPVVITITPQAVPQASPNFVFPPLTEE